MRKTERDHSGAGPPLPGAQLRPPYQVGDIVRHRDEFLRSVGMATSPINGEVQDECELFGRQWLLILWSDGVTGMASGANVEFCPHARAMTINRRAAAGAAQREGEER